MIMQSDWTYVKFKLSLMAFLLDAMLQLIFMSVSFDNTISITYENVSNEYYINISINKNIGAHFYARI